MWNLCYSLNQKNEKLMEIIIKHLATKIEMFLIGIHNFGENENKSFSKKPIIT